MNLFWEIFGYVGTGLILLSMAMTSMVKLRIFNMCGSVISLIYAVVMHTWPVAALNLGMILINAWRLLKKPVAKAQKIEYNQPDNETNEG